MSSEPPLRVLSIAHTAVSREAGRLRYHPFAARPELDVHLVVPARWHQFGRVQDADPADDPGITVHVLPIHLPRAGRLSWYLHVYPGLRNLIRRLRPQVVHLWEEPWSVVALQATLMRGKASLVMEVDQNILKRLPPPFEAMRRFVLRRTALVLSRSPDATAVVRACGFAGPAMPIGYGVDQQTFHPAPRDAVGRPGGRELRLGYVGRLVEEKGLDDALQALTLALSPISLAIMGEGPHEAHLRAQVRDLGLQGRVTFRGWGGPPEVADFLRSLDACLLLTRTTRTVKEQFGRVILEAQSCGIPVIGSTCGAIPDVVGEGGWIVPEKDPAALARVLDAICASPDVRRERAELARANVAARFTYPAIAETLARAWKEAAGISADPLR